jgi:predicted lipid-binding transport protein (Tim44 family)
VETASISARAPAASPIACLPGVASIAGLLGLLAMLAMLALLGLLATLSMLGVLAMVASMAMLAMVAMLAMSDVTLATEHTHAVAPSWFADIPAHRFVSGRSSAPVNSLGSMHGAVAVLYKQRVDSIHPGGCS